MDNIIADEMHETIPSSSREIDLFFAIARTKKAFRDLQALTDFAKHTYANLPEESGKELHNALIAAAEACFGKPWDQIKNMHFTIETSSQLEKFIKKK